MKKNIFILLTAMIVSGYHEAYAFWGNDVHQSPSGLDVVAGYDVNTVTTIRGTVITPPAKVEKSEHTQMTIDTGQGTATVLLGPWVYWEKQGFTVKSGQEISIIASRAQGKDGSLYLFAQRLDNITGGTSVTLRSETGSPLWSRGGGSGNTSGNGSGTRSGSGSGAGSGYRGGSMRGGGRR
jgi:uncharacterized membrane protein YgcG